MGNSIVTVTGSATHAAKRATTTIPILMVAINFDPIAVGYIDNLGRPSGNVTGLFFQHLELAAKRFGLFKEMLPSNGTCRLNDAPVSVEGRRTLRSAASTLAPKAIRKVVESLCDRDRDPTTTEISDPASEVTSDRGAAARTESTLR